MNTNLLPPPVHITLFGMALTVFCVLELNAQTMFIRTKDYNEYTYPIECIDSVYFSESNTEYPTTYIQIRYLLSYTDSLKNRISQLEEKIDSFIDRVNQIYYHKIVPWILQPNGKEDMAPTIEACLTTYGICILSKGDYYVNLNGVTMPSGSTLCGQGTDTRIILIGNEDWTPGQCITMGNECTVKDLSLWGWLTQPTGITATAVQNRHGILWTGSDKLRGAITNCRFQYFKGGAITCKETSSGIRNCLNVSDCYIQECRCGIYIPLQSEYHRFTNVFISLCGYGVLNNGGNNMFVNCGLNKNKIGFAIDNTDGTKVNNSHGSAIGCTINHSGNNTGIGVKINNTYNGFVFTSCQLFYSKIDLKDSFGISFDHCNFGQSEDITINGGGITLFDGCLFGSAPVFNITNNDNVHFNNCYVRESGAKVAQ